MNNRELLYSSALYSAAFEEGVSKEIYEDTQLVKKLFLDNSEYIKVLNSSQIELTERERLIDDAFKGNVNIFTLNFLKLLSKKRIVDIFVSCADHYEKSYFEDSNIERVKITTAVALSGEKQKAIEKKVASALGKTILSEFCVKPEIVGGMILETQTTAIDASVKSKLDNIKRYISKN